MFYSQEINTALKAQNHRPWPMPGGGWSYYQEWNNALFLHWSIDADILRPLVPASLQLDTLNGQCWVSVVAFNMERIRPKALPAFSMVSNFEEINVRTYVTYGDKAGVFFLSIEAGKLISALLAKGLSGLPYQKSEIRYAGNTAQKTYSNYNNQTGHTMKVSFDIKQEVSTKTIPDVWLSERYCLYHSNDNRLYRYHIHHLPWQLHHVDLKSSTINYNIGKINFVAAPEFAHYSPGVKVVAWDREYLK